MKKKNLLVLAALFCLSACGNVTESSTSSENNADASSMESSSQSSEPEEDVYYIIANSGDGYQIVDLSATEAKAGDAITFKVLISEETKILDSVTYNGIVITPNDEGIYSFIMPESNVRINVNFRELSREVRDLEVTSISLNANEANDKALLKIAGTYACDISYNELSIDDFLIGICNLETYDGAWTKHPLKDLNPEFESIDNSTFAILFDVTKVLKEKTNGVYDKMVLHFNGDVVVDNLEAKTVRLNGHNLYRIAYGKDYDGLADWTKNLVVLQYSYEDVSLTYDLTSASLEENGTFTFSGTFSCNIDDIAEDEIDPYFDMQQYQGDWTIYTAEELNATKSASLEKKTWSWSFNVLTILSENPNYEYYFHFGSASSNLSFAEAMIESTTYEINEKTKLEAYSASGHTSLSDLWANGLLFIKYEVHEEPKSYSITAETGEGYEITNLSAIEAKAGETVTFKVNVSDSSKKAGSVTYNGTEITSNDAGIYSFVMPEADVTIHVNIVEKSREIQDLNVTSVSLDPNETKDKALLKISGTYSCDLDCSELTVSDFLIGTCNLEVYNDEETDWRKFSLSDMNPSIVSLDSSTFSISFNVTDALKVKNSSGEYYKMILHFNGDVTVDNLNAKTIRLNDQNLYRIANGKDYDGMTDLWGRNMIFLQYGDVIETTYDITSATLDENGTFTLNGTFTSNVDDVTEDEVNPYFDMQQYQGNWTIYTAEGLNATKEVDLESKTWSWSFNVLTILIGDPDGEYYFHFGDNTNNLAFDKVMTSSVSYDLDDNGKLEAYSASGHTSEDDLWINGLLIVKYEAAEEEESYHIATSSDEGYEITDLSATEAKAGDTITFKVNVTDSTKKVDSVKYNEIAITPNDDGTYSFLMPGADVEINVILKDLSKEITDLAVTSVSLDANETNDKALLKISGTYSCEYPFDQLSASDFLIGTCNLEVYNDEESDWRKFSLSEMNPSIVSLDSNTFSISFDVTDALKVKNSSGEYYKMTLHFNGDVNVDSLSEKTIHLGNDNLYRIAYGKTYGGLESWADDLILLQYSTGSVSVDYSATNASLSKDGTFTLSGTFTANVNDVTADEVNPYFDMQRYGQNDGTWTTYTSENLNVTKTIDLQNKTWTLSVNLMSILSEDPNAEYFFHFGSSSNNLSFDGVMSGEASYEIGENTYLKAYSASGHTSDGDTWINGLLIVKYETAD